MSDQSTTERIAEFRPTPEELAEIEVESKAWAEAYSKPPCQECGAMSYAEALNKCICGGDKDDCHGCKLWPDD